MTGSDQSPQIHSRTWSMIGHLVIWVKNKIVRVSLKFQCLLKEPIEFISLTILKRLDCCGDWYNNVCLVIDGDIVNENCTNSDVAILQIKNKSL